MAVLEKEGEEEVSEKKRRREDAPAHRKLSGSPSTPPPARSTCNIAVARVQERRGSLGWREESGAKRRRERRHRGKS